MRTNPPPPAPRLIYLLNVAQRRVQRFVGTRRRGATPAQSGLLFVLGRQDGLSMAEVGAALDLGLPGISGLAERMMEAGLIKKLADPADGRAARLWLTAAGRKEMARAKASAADINARLMDGFTDAEIDVVSRWLRAVQTKFPKGDKP